MPAGAAHPALVPLVNIGYRSTNYWAIGGGPRRLLLDLGWPGGFGPLQAALARAGVPLAEIHYGLATHYHIDHAGCAQELKQAGMKLLVLETQRAAIPAMKQWTKPQDHYLDIRTDDNLEIGFAESRARLAGIGLAGQIIATPGHSDDSVSLLLDEGSVFTGDLTPPPMLGDDPASDLARASWNELWRLGARRVYPGHANPYPLAPV